MKRSALGFGGRWTFPRMTSMSVARATILYEWRRYLPALMSVAFAGVLIFMQSGLIFGIFAATGIYMKASRADLWAGFPNVQSVDLGHAVSPNTEVLLYSNPHVRSVEPFAWGGGEWRTPRHGVVNVYVMGLDAGSSGMALSQIVSRAERALLLEPGTILIDAADREKLGSEIGDWVEINGQRVRIVGLTRGLRGLGGVNVVASLATAGIIDPESRPADGGAAFYLAELDPGTDASAVARDLNITGARRGFEVMTAEAFARRSSSFYLFDSGAGVAFLFGCAMSVFVAIVITSQMLGAAIAGHIKEFAALRALGISMKSIRVIVMEQAMWVGLGGAAVAIVCTLALAVIAWLMGVQIEISPLLVFLGSALILFVAIASGAIALRPLAQSDPASLLT